MGNNECKCRCAGQEDVKEVPLVLPPPGADYNAAKVAIVSSRGFQQVSKTYCTCKVPGKGELCTTPVSQNGVYGFEGEVAGYKAGDALLFQVWEDEERSKELIGKVQVPGDKIGESGFEADLKLEDTKGGVEAFLKVRVELIFLEPPGTGVVAQVPAIRQEPPPTDGKTGVWVTFLKSQGSTEEVQLKFTKAPLGMSFDADRMPIVINALNGKGQAKELGVLPGMVIVKIAGVEISPMKYDEAYALMRDKVKDLPREQDN